MLATTHVWHYWIALPLVLGTVLFGVMTIIGYLTKVTKPKYPPRGQG